MSIWGSEVRRILPWRRGGLIALPDDDSPEGPSVPSPVLTTLHDDILHWSRLSGNPSRRKALWITADSRKIDPCAYDAWQLLSTIDGVQSTILVDVSQTRSIAWPLLHALKKAWPEFKRQVVAAKVVRSNPLLYDNSAVRITPTMACPG
jgi:hypothetical protein